MYIKFWKMQTNLYGVIKQISHFLRMEEGQGRPESSKWLLYFYVSHPPYLPSHLVWWVFAASLHQIVLLSVFPGNKFALFLQTMGICKYTKRKKIFSSYFPISKSHNTVDGTAAISCFHPWLHSIFSSCLTVGTKIWEISLYGYEEASHQNYAFSPFFIFPTVFLPPLIWAWIELCHMQ